jgi:putative hydrolase of the HAD superfamily
MDQSKRGAATARIRAVTFDCWGTLIHERDPSAGETLRVQILLDLASAKQSDLTRQRAEEALRAAHRRHVELWVRGVASGSREMARWALEALGLECTSLAREVAEALAEVSLTQEVVPLPGAAETLRELAACSVRLALVCDTGFSPGRVVRKLLGRTGLLEPLEVQAFSDEVGVPKPHARPFLAALGPLGVPPCEALHVGDLKRTDVAGGREIGMRTVRICEVHDDRAGLPDADHVVGSHAELRECLRDLRDRGCDS